MAAMGFIGVLFPLLFLGLIILVIAALVGARGEPDTTGRRPLAIYLSLITFIGLFMAIGASFVFLKEALDTVIVVDGPPDCPPGMIECGFGSDLGTGNGRDVLAALLVLLTAGALTYVHGKKLLELRALEPGSSSPSARTLQVFGYAVCFTAVIVAFGAVIAAVSALVDIIDPGGGFAMGRDRAASTLLTSIAIAALLHFGVFSYTWRTFDLGSKLPAANPPPPPSSTLGG